VRADLRPFGIAVGHATDAEGATGLTVIRAIDAPLRGSAHIIGRATGSRELALLDPVAANDHIDAVLLTGGSAYGLDAAAGVMRWMEERGRGFAIAGGVVPIVPAAVLFDLAPLGKFSARPTPAMAYDACDRASSDAIDEGSIGAGTGATVGKAAGIAGAMKGGVGAAIAASAGGSAFAIAAVNAFGDVRDRSGAIIAGARVATGAFGTTERMIRSGELDERLAAARNTTLAVVALDVTLTKVELQHVARSATAAFHRRLSPAGSAADGDIVFVLCPRSGPAGTVMRAEALATAALEDAIERGVRLAVGREGLPGLADAQTSAS
jgi:L-aminopeptidase/D-esterase-like protein